VWSRRALPKETQAVAPRESSREESNFDAWEGGARPKGHEESTFDASTLYKNANDLPKGREESEESNP